MESSVELVVPEEDRALRGLELAELHFPPERRAMIAPFLNIDADDPAMLPYLAWCASLGFSPVSGHVWLIPQRMKVRDGDGDRWIEKYRPAVGRDGLLHKARESAGRPGGYRGIRSDVVCERDTFEVQHTGDDLTDPKILHLHAAKPVAFAADVAPDRWRGRILGAWAKALVDGQPPVFFYASLREYGRTRERNGATVWEGAWSYTSSMILKAAQSYVLRIATGVTGVVPVDEIRDLESWRRGEAPHYAATEQRPEEAFDYETLPEPVRGRLRTAVAQMNELMPYSWSPAKCEMQLTGRSEAELEAVAAALEAEVAAVQASAQGAAQSVEEPPEAEVVPDGDADVVISALEHRSADLEAALTEGGVTEQQSAEILAELDHIEGQLERLRGDRSGG